MKTLRIKTNFQDARGRITDILDGVRINSVTLVRSKKATVRGNHFHKKTIQYLYVLQGKVKYYFRKGKGPVRSVTLSPGDCGVSPPGEIHTIVSLTASHCLVLTCGPRHGTNYEADTFRPKIPLVDPKLKKVQI